MAKTIEELLLERANSKTKKKKKTKKLHVESLGDTITITEPDKAFMFEIIKLINEDNVDDANAKIVYECVISPNLKEMLNDRSAYPEPVETVKKMFGDNNELELIAEHIATLSGLGVRDSVRAIDDEIKN